MPDIEWNESAGAAEIAPNGASPAESDGAPVPDRPVRRRKQSIFTDPLVRKLAIVAVGLVVLYLVAVISALLTGVLGSNLPQTAVENALLTSERAVLENPGDIDAWTGYVTALIADGQYRKAQDVIDQAAETVDQTKSQALTMLQAQLYLEKGDFEAVVKTCDEARDKIKAAYDAALADPESAESKLGDPIHINYWEVLVLKAEALVELGDNEGAIEILTEYLEENPTMQAVLLRRGDLRAEEGDTAGAEADYREALKYTDPKDAAEYEPIMDRLKKIGAE